MRMRAAEALVCSGVLAAERGNQGRGPQGVGLYLARLLQDGRTVSASTSGLWWHVC